MAKFIIYIPSSDTVMTDGSGPYIDDEKEVKRVISEETVHPKIYEIRPVAFLKTWAKNQIKKEKAEALKPYRFSPTKAEFYYKPPLNQKNYLLIVADEKLDKSGILVKDFDNIEDAVKLASTSINGLVKEFPKLGYYIYDINQQQYTRINNP